MVSSPAGGGAGGLKRLPGKGANFGPQVAVFFPEPRKAGVFAVYRCPPISIRWPRKLRPTAAVALIKIARTVPKTLRHLHDLVSVTR